MVYAYCFQHAMREISLIEYFDPNKKLGKTILRLPTKICKTKCMGAHADETPSKCPKWGVFFVGFIDKNVARTEHVKIILSKRRTIEAVKQ